MKMRSLLALLLCFILVQSQTYALWGGPDYSGGVSSLTGTYAGVLLVDNSSTATAPADNSLGVFAFGIPDSGVGTGAFLLFTNGILYNAGNIVAVSIPQNKQIQGILSASFSYSVTDTVTAADGTLSQATTDITIQANGKMKADVVSTRVQASSVVLLKGTASLDLQGATVDPVTGLPVITSTLDFVVSGYLQSTTATSPTLSGATTTGT
jgi:hypothetical protein